MNWSKAKSILIIFLLCTNLFLLATFVNSNYKRMRVPDDVINSAATLLASRGIEIDTSIIPNIIRSEKINSVENVIPDYESFAAMAIGENKVQTENGYKNDSATIDFVGDKFKIKFTEGLDTPDELKSPAEKAKFYLKKLGIEPKKASVSVTNDANGIFTVCFVQTIDKKPFFDCKVSVELNKSKITAVYGNWFINNDESGGELNLESVPALLVLFSSQHLELSSKKIVALKSGYALNDSEDEDCTFHKQTTIVPVLEITMSDEQKFYIDARSS